MKSILVLIIISNLIFLNELVSSLKLADSKLNGFKLDETLVYEKVIQFKNSTPHKKDEYRCVYTKIKKNSRQYITKLDPIGDKKIAHHMTLMGCENLPKIKSSKYTNSWDCESRMCGRGLSRRLYTWALNAKGIQLEDGVGIRVGGDTNLNYLVVQVHYNIETDEVDNVSSYRLKMTSQDLPYQVGIYNIGNNGFIPPKKKNFTFESACKYNSEYDIVPIFYRTHAHNIIRVMSIYLIKNEKWIELGRMSPYQPQMFYEVTNKNYIIQPDDVIASRCTINSMNRNEVTFTGDRHEDEMCAFYLMFYTDFKDDFDDPFCYKDGNKFKWIDHIETNPPDNASSLKGVHLIEPSNEPDSNGNHKSHH